MKKFLVLIAISAITIGMCWAKPVSALKNIPLSKAVDGLELRAKALSTEATVIDNFRLSNKKGDILQDDTEIEVICDEFINGQFWEMGPKYNYNFTYEPLSNTIWGISCARYSVQSGDSVRRIGELYMARYEKHKPLEPFSRAMWNVTFPYNSGGSVQVNVYDWFCPSIVIGNPTGTTDPKGLKVAVASRYRETPMNTTSSKYTNNWFGVVKTTNFFDTTVSFTSDLKSVPLSDVYTNGTGNHILNEHIKGQFAHLNGNPYAIYFSRLTDINDVNPSNPREDGRMRPTKYAIAVINLNNTDNDFYNGLEKLQILPESVHNIYGDYVMTLNNGVCSQLNIDYDNNNNIYLATTNTTDNIYSSDDLSGSYAELPIPTVVKILYDEDNANAYYEEIITSSVQIDTMPYFTIRDYIWSKGGIFDLSYTDASPRFFWFNDDHEDELPFIVSKEDDYSFIASMRYYITEESVAIDLVEINKSNGIWSIRYIDDVSETWEIDWAQPEEAGLKTAYYYNAYRLALYDYSVFAADNNDNTKLNLYTYTEGCTHDQQISRTADGQYLVVKWRETDRTKDYKQIPNTTIHVGGWRWPAAPDGQFQETINKVYQSKVKLSYRRIDDTIWSKPVTVQGDRIHNSISFRGTFMPRIIPSINDVIMSYAYGLMQSPVQQNIDILMAHNFSSYQYSGIVSMDAVTGTFNTYTSIKEEGPAITNNLEIYPNPIVGTSIANFKFSLLNPSNIKLSIQNSLGQEIAVLADEFCNAMEYSTQYNVSKLPIGVYYLTLTSGSFVKTKAFTVIK